MSGLKVTSFAHGGAPKTPVLFIHGFMGKATEWESLASRLDAPSFGIDLPGHGESAVLSGNEPWFNKTSEAIEEVITAQAIPVVDLVGYSLGGRVALHFAHQYPDRVRKMVVESGHPGLQDEQARADRLKSDEQWAEKFKNNWPLVLGEWYEQSVFTSLRGHLALKQLLNRQNDPEKLARAMVGYSLGQQDSQLLLRHPTLFIAGEEDQKYVQVGREWAHSSTQVQLFIAEGAGHIVHLERPEAYLKSIARFLELDLS
ncbi:MAG: alpha/beta fold hydrolase [Bacteroidetes bacterium]|nr:alpha/beta fold hydrolase [Bacteroidota bacterium]